MGVQLAIGLSPYLTAATNQFIDMATSGGSMGAKVTSALEMVVTGVANVADYLGLVKAGFYTMQGMATGTMFGIVKSIDVVGQSLTDLLNLLGVDAKWTAFAGMFADNLEQEMTSAFAKAGDAYNDFMDGKNVGKVKAAFDKIKADATAAGEAVAAAAAAPIVAIDHEAQKSADRIKGVLDGLQKNLETFGMSASDKKLFDLEAMGASPEQLDQAKKALDQVTALGAAQKKQQDQAAAAKSIYDATRSPIEQYEAHIGNLSDLLQSGALDWDTYGRAVKQAREELEGGKSGRDATLGERYALQARGGSGASSNFSVGGQRAAGSGASGGNGKIKVDGTDKTNKLLGEIKASLARGLPAVLV